jgi:hypothetical protein
MRVDHALALGRAACIGLREDASTGMRHGHPRRLQRVVEHLRQQVRGQRTQARLANTTAPGCEDRFAR